MRAVRTMDNCAHQKSGNHSAIGIAGDYIGIDDLLRHHDHALGGTDALEHHAEIPPAVGVAVAIGALRVDDSDVWADGAYRQQRLFALKRGKYLIEKMIVFEHVTSQRSSRGKIRDAHRARLQREGNGK